MTWDVHGNLAGCDGEANPLSFISKGFVGFEICPVNLFGTVLLKVFVKHTINALQHVSPAAGELKVSQGSSVERCGWEPFGKYGTARKLKER
jgi:hypothetical protein